MHVHGYNQKGPEKSIQFRHHRLEIDNLVGRYLSVSTSSPSRFGSGAYNSGWIGLKSVPMTIDSGYWSAVYFQDSSNLTSKKTYQIQ